LISSTQLCDILLWKNKTLITAITRS